MNIADLVKLNELHHGTANPTSQTLRQYGTPARPNFEYWHVVAMACIEKRSGTSQTSPVRYRWNLAYCLRDTHNPDMAETSPLLRLVHQTCRQQRRSTCFPNQLPRPTRARAHERGTPPDAQPHTPAHPSAANGPCCHHQTWIDPTHK
jgi:hypothetical protein